MEKIRLAESAKGGRPVTFQEPQNLAPSLGRLNSVHSTKMGALVRYPYHLRSRCDSIKGARLDESAGYDVTFIKYKILIPPNAEGFSCDATLKK